MSTLVIKEWRASNQPDYEGSYIRILGRQQGIISWILALLRIDPTTSIKVSQNRLEFARVSLSGAEHRMIPVGNICSTYYGYHKPWKSALFVFLLFGFVLNAPGIIGSAFSDDGISILGYLIGILLAILIAICHYFLRSEFVLGFVEHSGIVSMISFKRSVLENVDINEEQARYICEVTQYLIDSRARLT